MFSGEATLNQISKFTVHFKIKMIYLTKDLQYTNVNFVLILITTNSNAIDCTMYLLIIMSSISTFIPCGIALSTLFLLIFSVTGIYFIPYAITHA